MIGYVTVGSNDLEKARGFYDSLFGSIGAGRLMEFGENFTLYGVTWGVPGVAVCKPYNGDAATAGNGTMVALVLDSRDKVDAFHAKALELGMTGIGIADRNSVAGVVRAWSALEEARERARAALAGEIDFKLVVGARLVFADATPDIPNPGILRALMEGLKIEEPVPASRRLRRR